MIPIVVVHLFLLTVVGAMLMFEKVSNEHQCLLAMCAADSGCVPIGCAVDQFNRTGCGYFRLNIYQYRQCFQPGKEDEDDEDLAWIKCAQDFDCSAQCIRMLGARFRVKCYGKSDCESLARLHDGGANGCRDRNTYFYWRRVRDECGGACDKAIFTRY